jgi:hypothetical protein
MRSLLVLASLALPALALAQGSLTPPGAPAPSMKSLDQVEARTPIGTVGGGTATLVISSPGSYVLVGNVTVSSGNGIVITTADVTLDLNGFTLTSTAATANGNGVNIPFLIDNITIRNGHIRSSTTWDVGAFTGRGFANGIYFTGTHNALVEGITVTRVAQNGILLDNDFTNTTIRNCSVYLCGNIGLSASLVSDSSAAVCGSSGIKADNVVNSTGKNVAGSGDGIAAKDVSNSYGESTNPNSGVGIYADNVTNSSGKSIAGMGILAVHNATNCCGTSDSYIGLKADNATNCYGATTSGPRGLLAYTASFCKGENAADALAIAADIAIGCSATSGSIKATNRYLMP